jgi:hypothetical protein
MTQVQADGPPGAREFPDDAADLTADDHLAVETDKEAPATPTPTCRSATRTRVSSRRRPSTRTDRHGDGDGGRRPRDGPLAAGHGREAARQHLHALRRRVRRERSGLVRHIRLVGVPRVARLGADPQIPKAAYTPTFAQWFRDRGRWGNVPRPGAVVFVDFPGDGST